MYSVYLPVIKSKHFTHSRVYFHVLRLIKSILSEISPAQSEVYRQPFGTPLWPEIQNDTCTERTC